MEYREYRRYDAVGLAALIRAGEVSSDEVLQAALARLDEVNPQLNLLAHDLRERAFADSHPQGGGAVLAGVPFLLKDLLADWAGAPTWSGSRMMQQYVAAQNSDLTQAYLDAGLRVFGKTTTPEWGAYPVTEAEVYGITRNPWHLAYTPGGSSGGSAAAVAAGVVPVAHGGDGCGSIRLPAHNCGLFGLKPTRGRSSAGPLLAEGWQGMVCEHVLSRSVRDSALMLDIAARTQPKALYACPPPPANGFSGSLQKETGCLKVAFWRRDWLCGGGNDAGTEAALAHSLKLLADAGHEVEEASPEFAAPDVLNRAARVLVSGETAKLFEHYRRQAGRQLPHRLLEPVTWALMVQGRQISAGEMAWARDVMLAQEGAVRAFFERFDVLATPVCPRTPPKIGEMLPPPAAQKWMRLLFGTLGFCFLLKNNPFLEKEAAATLNYVGYTLPFNMSGNPAMSVPLYWHQGMPVGTQFAAAHGREDVLLRLAAQLEQMQPWAEREPPLSFG